MKDKFLILITGGTIDSHYDPINGKATIGTETVINDYFKLIKQHYTYDSKVVCLKSSDHITDEIREELLTEIRNTDQQNILITHGTNTMPDTAKYLVERLKGSTKRIILTGAMTPLTGFSVSDAGFNLGYAIAKFDHIEPGVYLCMNSQLFANGEVEKRLDEGRFYPAKTLVMSE